MHNEIGSVVLGGLSALFAGYGVRELTIAFNTTVSEEWSERAVPGAGGIVLSGLFALMTFQILV